jgi:hypothetical protein
MFALDAAGKLRNFHVHGMHHHVTAELFAKRSPPLAVRLVLGPVDTVRQFDDGHHRQCGVHFSVCRLHSR